MRSDRYLSRSAIYRNTLRRHFDAIRQEAGEAPAGGLRDYKVRANAATAASPVDRLKAWRFLAAFGMEGGATPHQIGASTGHETLKEAAHDPAAADRRRAVMGTEREENSAKHPAPSAKREAK